MEFYRSSAVGIALVKTLNEMLESKEINEKQALEILASFDKNFQPTLRECLYLDNSMDKSEAEGGLVNYNSFEDLWKIEAKAFAIKIGKKVTKYDKARILFNFEK